MGEPAVSLLSPPEEQGYRLTKSPGVGGELPAANEPLREHKSKGTQIKGAGKVLGSERKRSDLRRIAGSLSGA